MKVYERNGERIIDYRFDTLKSFVDYLKVTPISEKFEYRILESEKPYKNWVDPIDYNQALQICENGWDKNLEQLLFVKRSIDQKLLFPTKRIRVGKDIVGYAPSVPDFLNGNPINMYNTMRENVYDNIHIYVDLYSDVNATPSQIYNRGILILALIDALQFKGYSVEVGAFSVLYVNNEILKVYFNLKEGIERLNVKRAYFPLCSSAFVRRLLFRLIEVTPLQNNWALSYGKPVSASTLKRITNFDKNALVIPNVTDLGINGEKIDDDLKSFISSINLDRFVKKNKMFD